MITAFRLLAALLREQVTVYGIGHEFLSILSTLHVAKILRTLDPDSATILQSQNRRPPPSFDS